MFSTGCFPCLADFIVAPVVSVSPQPSHCSKGDSRVRVRVCRESAVPTSGLLIVRIVLKGRSAFHPVKQKAVKKCGDLYGHLPSVMHHIEVLSTRTRAGPFSLHGYFEIWPCSHRSKRLTTISPLP